MTDKNKTISFRVSEDRFRNLKKVAEDEEISLTELMRGRAQNILDIHEVEAESSTTELFDSYAEAVAGDEDFRNLVDSFYQDERSFRDFVESEQYFDTKWVDETSVDYDKMLEGFEEIMRSAQRQEFEQAYNRIDRLEDEGYERAAFLLDTMVEKYRE